MPCYFCDQIQKAKDNRSENFLSELSETFVFLKDSKLFPGYCLVVSKEHYEQLPELPQEKQADIFTDVCRVAEVIYSELSPQRINYECLGNLVPHIHWHVVPRYKDDPLPHGPIWQIDKSLREESNEASRLTQIKKKLADKLISNQRL